MESGLLAARLVLAVVFAVAGLAKLADLGGSRKAIVGFGVPPWLAAPLGTLLPLVELAIAVALLPATWAWYGAIGAAVLLLLFVLGIGVNLALGRTPDCHCFGQVHSEPVGGSTLVRNVLLAAVAGFVVWQGWSNPGPSAVAWVGDLSIFQRVALCGGIIGLILIAAEAWLLLQMLRQQGRLLLRLDQLEASFPAGAMSAATPADVPAQPAAGLPVGSRAPEFRLDGLRGETLTLDALLAANKPVLLLFTHPNCGPCQALMPDVGGWQQQYASLLSLAVISEGVAEDNRAKATEHGITQVLLQRNREVADAYQAYGTPAAVVVRPDGTIGSPLALGPDGIRALVTQTLSPAEMPAPAYPAPTVPQNGQNGSADQAAAALIKQGQLPPPLTFRDLNGKTISLSSLRGSETLLLFWNPGCGFCQSMLEDLKAWELRRPRSAPKLFVMSTGTLEDNRAMGLRSPVVLDETSKAGSTFGANGTPMAVLLDAKGRVASGVAAGAPAVLELAGAQQPASAS